MTNPLLNRKGLTLIELTIVLALLGIVLAIGYSYFFYSTSTFNDGESQSNIQRELRSVANLITRETRNAVFLTFVDSVPSDGNSYIVMDKTMHTLKNIVGGKTVYESQSLLDDISFEISRAKNGTTVLKFTIQGSKGNRKGTTQSKVFLVNLGKTPGDPTNKKIIQYQKP